MNYSIKETKELLLFVAKFGNALDKALLDGKINLMDAGVIFEPLLAAKDAFNEVAAVPKELADLTEDEAIELNEAVAEELDLDSESTEILTEKGLALVLALINFYKELKNA
jgi:hypothetical protein